MSGTTIIIQLDLEVLSIFSQMHSAIGIWLEQSDTTINADLSDDSDYMGALMALNRSRELSGIDAQASCLQACNSLARGLGKDLSDTTKEFHRQHVVMFVNKLQAVRDEIEARRSQMPIALQRLADSLAVIVNHMLALLLEFVSGIDKSIVVDHADDELYQKALLHFRAAGKEVEADNNDHTHIDRAVKLLTAGLHMDTGDPSLQDHRASIMPLFDEIESAELQLSRLMIEINERCIA